MKRKLLSLVLALVLLAGLMPTMSLADDQYYQNENGVKFHYTGTEELTITRIEMPQELTGTDYTLSIPGTIDGRPVTVLSGNYYENLSQHVVIPASVRELADAQSTFGVFSQRNITDITFEFAEGSRLKYIGTRAFFNCGVTDLELPDSVETIADEAFYNCALTSISIGSSQESSKLKSIGAHAFEGTHISSILLPDSLETIGESAFNGVTGLTGVTFGSSLKSIGSRAFQSTSVTALDFPDSLETIGKYAFWECGELTSITWPHNDFFTEIAGFKDCVKLTDNSILSSIPGSVTSFGYAAFQNCGFTTLAIGAQVESIGAYAFANNPISTLTVSPGDTPLTIGASAFSETKLGNKTVDLPTRVSVLNEGAFGFIKNCYDYAPGENYYTYYGPEIHIRNKNISFVNDETYYEIWETTAPGIVQVFCDSYNAKIYYPADMNSVSFTAYKDYVERFPGGFPPVFLVEEDQQEPEKPVYTITGTIPAGASVAVVADAAAVPVTLTGQSFTASAAAGSYVTVLVSQDGCAEKSFAKTGAEFTADWALGEIALTPLSETGVLDLTLAGVGAAGANVAVFDAGNKLVWSGSAAGASCIVQDLPAGGYTVMAFADNPYISSVSAVGDLAALGLAPGSWATAAVTIARAGTTRTTLSVPAMDTAQISAIVVKPGSDVLIERAHITPNLAFLARVSYVLSDGHTADSLRVTIPAGFRVESVASYTTQYSLDAVYNAGTNLVTVTGLTGDEAADGSLFLLLRGTTPGKFGVSAAAHVGSAWLPLGSADFRLETLAISAPAAPVTGGSFEAAVYAAPNSAVTVQIDAGAPQTVTTNANGMAKVTLSVPADALYTRSATILATQEGVTPVKEAVAVQKLDDAIQEFFFVHAFRRTNGILDGRDVSGGYYAYIADGREETKYWSFSATIHTPTPIMGGVTLHVRFLDNSEREQAMSLAALTADAGGCEQTYVATMYIDTAGDHTFDSSLIPNGFYVTYVYDDQPFVLDGNAVQYVQGVSEAEQRQFESDVGEWSDLGGWALGNEGFFGGDYVLHDEAWFGTVPADGQDAIRAAEEAFRALCEAISDALGLDRPINEYNDDKDMLDGAGIDIDPPPGFNYDPDTLRGEGYTVATDGSYGVRENRDAGGKPRSLEYADSKGGYLKLDYQENAFDNVKQSAISQAIGIGSNALDGLNNLRIGLQETIAGLSPAAEKAAAEAELLRITKLGGGLKIAGNVAGGITGCWQAWTNSSDYVDSTAAVEELKGDLRILHDTIKSNYVNHGASSPCIRAVDEEIIAGDKLLTALMNQKGWGLTDTVIGATFTAAGALASLLTGGLAAGATAGANLAYDLGSNTAGLSRADEIAKLQAAYTTAHEARLRQCGEQQKKGLICSYTPILDPSGIVYEAVESNLLEGVTATAYNTAGVWNAADYDQVNPQVTLSDGAYAWDVPPGTWHVVFTKDGYNSAQTADMPVPPPRMNLRTAMTASAAPAVAFVNAYSEYVELAFTQYMDTVAPLTVPDGWTYAWVDAEPVSATDATTYAKVLRLTPPAPLSIGDLTAVTLSGAKNYAGTNLPAYDSGELTVTARPASMKLNYANQVAVLIGESPTPRVVVTVLDDAGAPLPGLTVGATAASGLFAGVTAVSAVTDDNGAAIFSVNGFLPGLTSLTFTVDGTTLTKTVPLRVTVDDNRVARPTADLGGTTIGAGAPKDNYVTADYGSTLTIACATPGAAIYYTTNGTCPCQSAERTVYTSPIVLTQDTYFRICAYKDGMEYSDRLNLHVTVAPVSTPSAPTTPAPYEPDDDGYIPTYAIQTEKAEHGTVKTSYKQAVSGAKVTITAVPDAEHEVGDVTVTGANGKNVAVTKNTDETYRFTMPASRVTVTATFLPVAQQACPQDETCPMAAFDDLDRSAWYHNGVHYILENGLMNGVGSGKFAPDGSTSRAMIVTILYRIEGEPDVSGKENPFEDVADGTWYADAVLWAAENKIVEGDGKGHFNPNGDITREQLAVMLYNYAQFKGYDVGVSGGLGSFPDSGGVSAWARDAMAWAVAAGIINGTTDAQGNVVLAPQGLAARAEVAAMFQRFCENVA